MSRFLEEKQPDCQTGGQPSSAFALRHHDCPKLKLESVRPWEFLTGDPALGG